MRRVLTLSNHERVSESRLVPSAKQSDIRHVSALSAIRVKRIMRRTSVRIGNAHIAKSTVMMQSDVLKNVACSCMPEQFRTSANSSSLVPRGIAPRERLFITTRTRTSTKLSSRSSRKWSIRSVVRHPRSFVANRTSERHHQLHSRSNRNDDLRLTSTTTISSSCFSRDTLCSIRVASTP